MHALPRFLALSCALLSPVFADPIITEFCASNQNGLEDEDGSHSDWLEIHNPDDTVADLTGWYLTDKIDQKTKWQFPATTIAPGGYLVVFASDKNRAVAGSELHTSFALSAGGEYLGLIKADGATVASEYAPEFPQQSSDITYGIPSNIETLTLVGESAACQWIVPTSASTPGSSWFDLNFSHAGWNSATQGIGYDRTSGGTDYNTAIGTNGNIESASVAQNNPTCLIRIPFTVVDAATLRSLKLRVKCDDGFAVWLNGQPLLSGGVPLVRRAPSTLLWNSAATSFVGDAESFTYQEIDVSENLGNLVAGTNVLAIQSMNYSPNTTDQFVQAELLAENVLPGTLAPGFFAIATPGAANPGADGLVIPQRVGFSKASSTFSGNLSLTLSGAIAGQVIRYTLDGSIPTADSPLYSGAITLSSSALVRARVQDTTTGRFGFVVGNYYEQLAANLSNYASTGVAFRSALPIVVLNNNNAGELPNDNQERPTRIQIFDRNSTGYSSLATTANPTQVLNAGVKLRGRSSASFPKKSYGIEIHSEEGEGQSVSILGMPAGEDWALTGSWNYDRAFMRNAWINEISRQAGHWAPRTRLVEVYFNQDGNNLSYNDYRGVYVLTETVRLDNDRVDITKISPADVTEPNLSGGYIFKVDAPESDEYSWTTNRNLPPLDALVIHRPKRVDLPPVQSSYLQNYFQQFENTVFNEANGGFATRNYRNYIDSASWADLNLFNMVAKNVDGLRLSTYYQKDRGGKLEGGPVWDFDRSVASDDRGTAFNTWNGTGDATNYLTYAWWEPLFRDVEFRQVYIDRWHALRQGPLATANVNAVLDSYLAEFKATDTDNPASRDYARWYGSATSYNIATETASVKTWLANRSAWVDSQFRALPTISLAPGVVTAGQTTTISVPSGTTVYYTTDGTDPRLEGGGISTSAIAYSSAVPIPSTTRIIARSYAAGNYPSPSTAWSGIAEALYLVDEAYATASQIRISALNYRPLTPSAVESAALPNVVTTDFEWIELQNISQQTVNLQGLSLAKGAPVSAVTLPPFSLVPGARAVIAKNLAAFTQRYGAAAAARVVTTWSGDQSMADDGDEIQLLDRAGSVIADFEYSNAGDDWPARSDGAGSASEYIGTLGTTAGYENPASWMASTSVHGSPGTDPAALSGVVINEILASDSSAPDAIELHNPGSSAVDVSGWFLSNTSAASTENDYRLFKIPADTVLPANGYLVFDESDFNPTPQSPAETHFSLDGTRGGKVWLISADPVSGKLTNFEQQEIFDPALPGVANGRFPNATGPLAPLSAVTLGATNAEPRIGLVQVSEIQYHPAGTAPEFIEIFNSGTNAENLGSWTLRGDVDYDFPTGFSLAAGEAIVMVSFDPALSPTSAAAFRTQYGVAESVRLVGPWSEDETLSNSSGTVRLRRRVPAPIDEPTFVGLMIEDEVNYLSTAPWPTGASGSGSSIRRLGIFSQASDPASWIAAAATPGSDLAGYVAWQLGNFSDPANGLKTGDPDSDGMSNLIEYLTGNDPNAFDVLPAVIDPNSGTPRLVLDYTRRTDRDDGVLSAEFSDDLIEWQPAPNDDVVTPGGLLENRRAWLPVDGNRGFLRLKAE